MKSLNASDLIWEIEGNRILCSRGDIAVGYRLDYPEKYSQGEQDFETIHSTWVRALRNVPTGTIVVKSDCYIKTEFDASQLPAQTFLQKATRQYFHGREYMAHRGYVFFVYTRLNTLKNDAIKNPFVFPSQVEFNKEDIALQTFLNEIEQAEDIINRSNLIRLIPLLEPEILNFRDFYFNGFQVDYLTDVEIEKDRIQVDNKQVGIFTLNNEQHFPDVVTPAIEDGDFSSRDKGFVFYEGFLDCLGVTLGCSHVYNQIVFIDEHKHHLKKISTNETNLQGARRLSPENAAGAKTLQGYIQEAAEDPNYHYIRGHNNLVFWAADEAEFEYHKKKISALLKSHDIKPAYPTRERLKNVFYNTFFTNVSCLNNENLYLVDLRIAASLFITNSNYKNDDGGVLLNDRIFNIPVRHDIWDAGRKRKKSRNFAIIAPTGSGKSFAWEHISRQLIEDNVTNVIIDLGDSHIKMAKLFPPEQVAIFKYEAGKPLGLNPFGLLPGEKPTALKIEELCEFVWTLIKKQGEPSENERTSLRKIINHYYITEEDYWWDTFYYFIKANKERIRDITGIEGDFFNIEEFIHAGSDFIGEGIYSDLFRRDKDISSTFIGKKIIIFELDEIQDNKLLLSIMLQVISEAIHKTVWRERSSRGIVFYDEFAKQLEFPEILQRVKYQTQAIRKQNGAVGIVLQTLNQMPETPEGKSILDNTETYIFLQGGDYRTSIDRLHLGEHDKSQLYSLASNFNSDRPYSEFYLKEGNYGNVFRIEVPKEVFLAYQTEGEVHEKLMQLYEQAGSMEAAIQTYMSQTK